MTGSRPNRPAVLVLRALGLGDLATAVPALRGIRRAFPDHRVVLATSAWLEPLVADMEFVDAMLATEEMAALPVQLDEGDVAVNLHGRGPQSTAIMADTAPSRLIAFAHPDLPATYGFPAWKRREHEVIRWCRLLSEFGVEARPDEISLPLPRRSAGSLTGSTVLHPGASSPARQWPPDRWASVASALASAGERVVVTGNVSEVSLAREIARRAGLTPESVLAGRTNLGLLAALIASAGRLVTSDTGPSHLATAYGTPSLTLFGPTPPHEWGPPPHARHLVIWKGKSGPPNADRPDPGLLEITEDEVLELLDRLPARPVRFWPPPSPPLGGPKPAGPAGPDGHRRPGAPRRDGS